MSVSLPRKVLCDTSGRCLTACQHREPVLFFHCILKYQAALVMARWRWLQLLLSPVDADNEQT